jgi:hypothetical protein
MRRSPLPLPRSRPEGHAGTLGGLREDHNQERPLSPRASLARSSRIGREGPALTPLSQARDRSESSP